MIEDMVYAVCVTIIIVVVVWQLLKTVRTAIEN